jgi:glycosyltransferase involved in cell wall biosynthesis
MIPNRLSVIIPARNEEFLRPTVEDLFKQAAGDIEVIAVLDGWWDEPQLPDDKRLHILHWGASKGMRPSINAGVQMSTGQFVMKLDGHCAVAPGFDEALKKECGEQEIVVPTKYSLEPTDWSRRPKEPWNYFWMIWPWDPAIPNSGLIARNYGKGMNKKRAHLQVDDLLTFQGSLWCMRRSHFDRIGPMDGDNYYFIHEGAELGLKTWLGGGRVKIVKDTWYAHLFKGEMYKRAFPKDKSRWDAAMNYAVWYWMTNQWKGRVHDFSWIINKFGLQPGWPENWQQEAEMRLHGHA